MSAPSFTPPTPDYSAEAGYVADTAMGPIVSASHVRDAVERTLQLWIPTYVDEIGRQVGKTLLPFEAWEVQPDYRTMPVDLSPACIVNVPGTTKKIPDRHGDGTYRAYWRVEVDVILYGQFWMETADLCGWYQSAVRAALVQHGSLGGFATSTLWQGETYGQLEHTASRTLGAGRSLFEVVVDPVVNAYLGPAVPPSDPTQPQPQSPLVETTSVTVKETLTP